MLKLKPFCFLTVACVSFIVTPVRADVELTVAIADFNEGTGAAQMQTSGKALLTRGGIRLTKAVGTTVGAAHFNKPLTMSAHRSFSAYFTFRMTKPECKGVPNGGADGLAFVLQPDRSVLGRGGGGLGYQGVPASLAVEFDSHVNPGPMEPEKQHVAINVNGEEVSLASAAVPFTFNDGQIHHAWIDYDGKDDSLQVRVALTNARPAEALLSHKVDLEKILGSEQYVGFTASTGTCFQQHDVFSMYFNADNLLQGIDPSTESYQMTSH